MRRPGCDEQRLEMSDVLCDFCGGEWTLDRPMVEGHRGSCICGGCLAAAYRAVVLADAPPGPADGACTLCLERREEASWRAPGASPGAARACRRCIRQSAAVLQKDTDSGWQRPVA